MVTANTASKYLASPEITLVASHIFSQIISLSSYIKPWEQIGVGHQTLRCRTEHYNCNTSL